MSNRKSIRPSEKVERHYVWIVILFLVIVGSGVIYLVFGASALILAVPILIGGALLLLLPFLLMQIIGWLLEKYHQKNKN
ncbi:MAG: hypothetical protein CL609_09775 [Anaerolineaceae bacterium]|nr:hypothetical protein [Anaerolineaceae bacterium]